MNLTYFLLFIVMGMLLFMYVYARYSYFDNDIRNREADLEEKEEKTRLRLEAIDRDIQEKKIEMAILNDRLEALKKEIRME